MFLFNRRKRKKELSEKNYISPEEHLLILKDEKTELIKSLKYEYERKEKIIKEKFQALLEQANLSEKRLSFTEIIFDADNKKHPLIYEITHANHYAQHYLFSRGRFTPNPYKIEVNNHKNVLFLRCYENSDTENPIIFLHYDKMNNKYTEFSWTLPSDYVEKFQIKQFLYDLMKAVFEKRIENFDKVQSYHSAFFAFERTLEGKSFEWKAELEAELELLRSEKMNALEQLADTYKAKAAVYQDQVEKNNEMKRLEKEKNRLLDEHKNLMLTENFNQLHPNSPNTPSLKKNFEGHIADDETHIAMRKLFYRVQELLSYEHLLDPHSQHDLTSLYGKDIHELWYGFIKLDTDTQTKEKYRFLALVDRIHNRLNTIEAKVEYTQTIDYEKKMTFLESKYKH